MLVMTLLAILTAMVTPVFRGTLSTVRSENGVRDFVATLEYAQTRAITDAKEYRLYLSPTLNGYWLEHAVVRDGIAVDFETFTDALPFKATLPDSLHLSTPKARRDKKTRLFYVAFYPNGLCDENTFSLNDPDDDSRYVVSTSGTRVQWAKGDS